MSAHTTVVGDVRRVDEQRRAAKHRHPTQRAGGRPVPVTPPPASFYLIAVIAAVFTVLGLVMVLSATSVSQFHKGNSPWTVFERQFWWAGFGVFGAVFAMRTPLHLVRRVVPVIMLAAFALMTVPFVPGLGVQVRGARAWVEIGSLTFQPSEFLKFAVLLQCAHVLARRSLDRPERWIEIRPLVIVGALAAGMCVLQGDLGSAIVLGSTVFGMAFIGGVPLVALGVAGLGASLLGVVFVVSSEYRLDRFTAFLDLAGNKSDLSYQVWQSQIAIAQGGITGAGVGRGGNKLGEFLPLAHSDFIFAVVAEELGMVGVLAVLGGFVALVYAAVQVALATHDRFHAMLAGGVASWFAVQTVINIGGVTGLLPVTGLTLPFFSAGGSSLMVTLAATGVLLNVARNVR